MRGKKITEIDGLAVRFGGDYPTLVIRNQDIPGQVQQVTTFLAEENINVSDLLNRTRGEYAYAMFDLDSIPSESAIEKLNQIDGVIRVREIDK